MHSALKRYFLLFLLIHLWSPRVLTRLAKKMVSLISNLALQSSLWGSMIQCTATGQRNHGQYLCAAALTKGAASHSVHSWTRRFQPLRMRHKHSVSVVDVLILGYRFNMLTWWYEELVLISFISLYSLNLAIVTFEMIYFAPIVCIRQHCSRIGLSAWKSLFSHWLVIETMQFLCTVRNWWG